MTSLPIDDAKLWLPKEKMFVGSSARKIIQKANDKDPVVKDVTEKLKLAFVKCGTKVCSRKC